MEKIKVIKNEEDYQKALHLLAVLIENDPEPDSTKGEQAAILSALIGDYESHAFPSDLPNPIDAIKFRMEQSDLTPKDLIPYIGSRSKVSEILSGKRQLSLEMIRALETGLGVPAKVLIQKQETSKYQDWSDVLVKEMRLRGYFGSKATDNQPKESLLSSFFGNSLFATKKLAWRKTSSRISLRTDQRALSAWAEYVQKKASKIKTLVKYKEGLVNFVFMQEVARMSNREDGPLVTQEFLRKNGIILVIAKHLPKTKVDGVTILNHGDNPIIGLSLRFDRLDNFWFTLLHELAHVSDHQSNEEEIIFDELEDAKSVEVSEKEKKADLLAQEAIIPESKWQISPARMIPSSLAAQSLANELNIHVALVAGVVRYKHQNYSYLNGIVNNEKARVRRFFPDEF